MMMVVTMMMIGKNAVIRSMIISDLKVTGLENVWRRSDICILPSAWTLLR